MNRCARTLLAHYRMLRHLEPVQVIWRARRRIEDALGLRPCPNPPSPESLDPAVLDGIRKYIACLARYYPPSAAALDAVREGRFTFLNETRPFTTPFDWEPAGTSVLWRFHLHYFDYARMLAAGNANQVDEQDRVQTTGWMRDWVSQNPPFRGTGWHPFVISCRLVNWLIAAAVFGDDAALRQSLARQAAVLQARPEYDVRANHLLKNAVALVLAHEALGTRARDKTAALDLLERETTEQILPDGGHIEGSAMYHAQILEDFLLLHAALPHQPAFLADAISRMTAFLVHTVHTDGDIPLFNDAALGAAMPTRALVPLACELTKTPMPSRGPDSRALEASGWYVFDQRDATARLAFKAASPAPEYQMGHSHADLFSWELSMAGRRVVVDSGVHDYEAGPWREYCRSTRAHNTVSLNGRDQYELWGAFRIGRRCRARIDAWRPEGSSFLRVSHDGFAPFVHQRAIRFVERRFWIIEDTILGSGIVSATNCVHFAPDTRLEEAEGVWTARLEGATAYLKPFGAASVERVEGGDTPRQGWYCPEFGRAFPAPTLILFQRGPCPVRFGYAIFVTPADILTTKELDNLLDAAAE